MISLSRCECSPSNSRASSARHAMPLHLLQYIRRKAREPTVDHVAGAAAAPLLCFCGCMSDRWFSPPRLDQWSTGGNTPELGRRARPARQMQTLANGHFYPQDQPPGTESFSQNLRWDGELDHPSSAYAPVTDGQCVCVFASVHM